MTFDVPKIDYTQYSNRQLAAVPLGVLALALAVLAAWYVVYGTPVALGIEFTGGSELTVQTSTPRGEIAGTFDEQPASIQEIQGTGQPTYIVTFQSSDAQGLANQAESGLQAVGDRPIVLSRQETAPSFASDTQQQALVGVVVAFLGMSLLAFVLFRTFVPSIAIVISAFSDIMIPLAVMDVLNIQLTLGTVAALLMLIGYSVDSDILLNNHILRRTGEFYESTHRAMRTGVTMTLTSLSAMIVMAITAYLFGIELLSSIGLVLAIGLAADLMNTYLLNLSLLRWYKLGAGVVES